MGLATGFVIALGVVAARADEHCDHMLAEERLLAERGEAARWPEPYPPPPEVATAMAVAPTTSSAVIVMSKRSPEPSLGKLGRRTPIPTETNSAHATSRPPAI
jgi:hypothetical protein